MVSGKGSVEFDAETSNLTDRMTISFLGDIIVPLPNTFEEAKELYKSLPEATLKSTKVVEFSLSKIEDKCTGAEVILNRITNENVEKVFNHKLELGLTP